MDRAEVTRRLRRELRLLLQLRRLPPRVALFQWRAHRLARRIGDEFSIVSATRPHKLEVVLSLAEDRVRVAELGTATGWTALSLLLADPRRTVVTFDPVDRPARRLYLDLVRPHVRERLTEVTSPGSVIPNWIGSVDFLYVDSSHDRDETITELEAWRPRLEPNALIVLDDFTHPDYPGVREAVARLELAGEERQGVFIARRAEREPLQRSAQPSAQS
jgi:predicted O-methyltransferase YrrM